MSGGLDVLKLTVSIICIVVFYVLSHIFKYPICVNRFLSDLCISDYCLRPIILVARHPPPYQFWVILLIMWPQRSAPYPQRSAQKVS